MEWEVSPTPALYNSVKLCKPFGYLECKRNKWNYEEGGGGGKFELVALMEMKFKGIESYYVVE